MCRAGRLHPWNMSRRTMDILTPSRYWTSCRAKQGSGSMNAYQRARKASMFRRLTCFVSGEHHYRMLESGGRVFRECQQCGQRSAGLESSNRPVLTAGQETRPASAPKPTPSIRLPKTDADQFLRETLADGPMRQVDVTKAATLQGIADRTLRRARGRLGVVATKHGFGSGSFWVWRLRPAATGSGPSRVTPAMTGLAIPGGPFHNGTTGRLRHTHGHLWPSSWRGPHRSDRPSPGIRSRQKCATGSPPVSRHPTSQPASALGWGHHPGSHTSYSWVPCL